MCAGSTTGRRNGVQVTGTCGVKEPGEPVMRTWLNATGCSGICCSTAISLRDATNIPKHYQRLSFRPEVASQFLNAVNFTFILGFFEGKVLAENEI